MRCRVCGRPLTNQESIRRGVGSECARHSPPEHLANHSNTKVQRWAESAYSSARSAYVLFKKRQYLESLYLAHLAIEKMLKTLMIIETDQFDYGHNLNNFISKISLTQDMPEWMRDVCARMNQFQTAGRYPDEKLDLLRAMDPQFVQTEIRHMEKVLAWLSEQTK